MVYFWHLPLGCYAHQINFMIVITKNLCLIIFLLLYLYKYFLAAFNIQMVKVFICVCVCVCVFQFWSLFRHHFVLLIILFLISFLGIPLFRYLRGILFNYQNVTEAVLPTQTQFFSPRNSIVIFIHFFLFLIIFNPFLIPILWLSFFFYKIKHIFVLSLRYEWFLLVFPRFSCLN